MAPSRPASRLGYAGRSQGRIPNASILRNNRVVFRIRGNNYRLVAVVFYASREVYIRFIGTHAEYNRINANEV